MSSRYKYSVKETVFCTANMCSEYDIILSYLLFFQQKKDSKEGQDFAAPLLQHLQSPKGVQTMVSKYDILWVNTSSKDINQALYHL